MTLARPPGGNTVGGLTASELAAAVAAIDGELAGARVTDVARLRNSDDLLVFLQPPDPAAQRRALHVVPGGVRGRITTTTRRFARDDFATGPLVDALRARLAGGRLEHAAVEPGERIARLAFRAASGDDVVLVAELFGNRGIWCLLDEERRILDLARLPKSAGREIEPGAKWTLPPRAPAPPQDPAGVVRFAEPLLASIDAAFTAADLVAEANALREDCARALARATRACEAQIAGLTTQLVQAENAPDLRARADLLLAYAHGAKRGAASLRVPDPAQPDSWLDLPLDPTRSVPQQAKALYDRARRLEDATSVALARRSEAEARRGDLAELTRTLDAASDLAALGALHADLIARRLLKPAPGAPPAGPTRAGAKKKPDPATAYRRFVSVEGYDIFCGRDNHQNDRLTKTARGNDCWLHIGRGYAGSHVVIRVPKGKSASLETLLDAAAIAVHFSKARGAERTDVIYTLAKHVRKPKGSPPGSVVPHHTKTLQVRADPARLRRLLDGAGDGDTAS